MKIVTYNINYSSHEKIERVLAHNADIFILPEVACPSQIKFSKDFRMEWMGYYDHKGLGIIWRSCLKAEIPEWFNPQHQYFLPLILGGTLIVAAWPTKTEQNKPKSYPQIAFEALQEYSQHLKEYPCVISGDMNCYKGQSGESKKYSIQSIIGHLRGLGFYSAYHDMTGESLGEETTVTYYHHFKENAPFFIDYTFANMPLKSYKIGKWNRDISDHVPQFIEI